MVFLLRSSEELTLIVQILGRCVAGTALSRTRVGLVGLMVILSDKPEPSASQALGYCWCMLVRCIPEVIYFPFQGL